MGEGGEEGEGEGREGRRTNDRSLASPSALGRGLVFIPAATENKETLVLTYTNAPCAHSVVVQLLGRV